MRTMALGIPKTIPLFAVPLGLGLLLSIYMLKLFNGNRGAGPSN
jgi:TRAP-type C4-dicarboxylate transport system permease small subunit